MAKECCIDIPRETQHEIQQADEKATSKGHVSREDIHCRVSEEKKLLDHELQVEANNKIEDKDRDDQSDTSKIQHLEEIMPQFGKVEEYLKPRAFAIGPIHASNSDLLKRKNVKIKLAANFIKENDQTLESLLEVVRDKIVKLKDFFDQLVITEYDDDSLAWQLFLDGCALLQFIRCYVDPDNFKELKISNNEVALMQQDLFLLENQIPYLLLDLLMGCLSSSSDKSRYTHAIVVLVAKSNIIAPITGDWGQAFKKNKILMEKNFKSNSEKRPVHLLDLLLSILGGNDKDDAKSNEETNSLSWIPCFGKSCNRHNKDVVEILKNMYRMRDDGIGYSFRSVQELKSAGIKLKPSYNCSLRSVSFVGQCFNITGQLKIPPLMVEDSTIRKLMNLVAYKRCLGKDYVLLSYLKLLDLFIDSEKDVIELRKANVLLHRLSSDNEVAKLFNDLGSSIMLLPKEDFYDGVALQIDRHCRRKCPIWIAQFRRGHCSSPCTVLAFLLTLIACFLTLRELWSNIFP